MVWLGLFWLDAVLAALSALVALWVSARLLAARRGGVAIDRLAEVAHLLMGLGMAAMFAPAADPLPRLAWVLVFGVYGAWLVAAVLRADERGPVASDRAGRAHAVVSTAAMVYMFAAMGGGGQPDAVVASAESVVLAHDHAAGGVDLVPVTAALGVYFVLHAGWSALRGATGAGCAPGAAGAHPILFGARAVACCHAVMGLAMGYMFFLMLV